MLADQRENVNNPLKLNAFPWRMYLTIGIVGLIITGIAGYGFYTGQRISTVATPFLNAIREVKLEAASAHLWMDEIIEGTDDIEFDEALKYLEQAVWYFRVQLERGIYAKGHTAFLNDAEIGRLAEGLRFKLIDFKSNASQWLTTKKDLIGPAEMNQSCEAFFDGFVDQLNQIEQRIQVLMARDIRRFRFTQILMISTCIVLSFFVALSFRRFERGRAKALISLNTTNEKLLSEIAERRRAVEALAKSETKFRSLFESATELIHMLDEKGTINHINPAVVKLLGYREAELTGRKLAEFFTPDSRRRFDQNFALLLQKGTLRNEYELVGKNGDIIYVDCSAVVIRDKENHVSSIVSFQKDISDRKLSERKMRASHRFLQISNKHSEMAPLLNEFVKEIKKLTACGAVGMRILDEDGNIPYAAYDGFSREFYQAENLLSICSDHCMCVNVIRNLADPALPFFTQAGSFFTNSTTLFMEMIPQEQKAFTRNNCNRYGYESVALIPIRSGEQNLGLIHVASTRKNMLPRESVNILEGAALQLATAVQRVKAEEALRNSHDKLEQRVEERTGELVTANAKLENEIAEHRQAQKELLSYQAQLRSLSSQLLLTEARERRRIASEIHDRIGQSLAMVKIRLGVLSSAGTVTDQVGHLGEIRKLIEQTIYDTRSLTFELSPPILYELGLEAAVEWLAEQIQQQHGFHVEVDDDKEHKPLAEGYRVFVFQAARELLFNIAKHARAKSVKIAMRKNGPNIQIDIIDDGVGFDISKISRNGRKHLGFGLFSIRENLRQHGGRLTIRSRSGQGTHATLIFPLDAGNSTQELVGT